MVRRSSTSVVYSMHDSLRIGQAGTFRYHRITAVRSSHPSLRQKKTDEGK